MYKTAYYDYPELPEINDPQWTQVTIRSRVENATALRTEPDVYDDNIMMMVYSGDVVSVMRDCRYDKWIAAKVGYKMGWLNVSEIGFKLIRQSATPPPVYIPTPSYDMRDSAIESSPEWYEITTENAIPQELLTSQLDDVKRTTQTHEAAAVNSNDLCRIIKHLKGFAGAFSGRRAAAHRG